MPYFIVARKINGTWQRFIERLHTREFTDIKDAFFVDSGMTYSGTAANEISGLDHLETMNVVALADGNVITGLKVSGGKITLPLAAAKVHVGLAYTATLQTLDLDLGQVQATLRSGPRKIHRRSDVSCREDARHLVRPEGWHPVE